MLPQGLFVFVYILFTKKRGGAKRRLSKLEESRYACRYRIDHDGYACFQQAASPL